MGKRNVTVQLPDSVIDRAKVVAARRGTSLSGLLTRQICQIADRDDSYERARYEAMKLMDEAADSDRVAPRWTREELYDR